MLKPKYRFPEFQEDWLQTSLGEVVEENLEPIPMPKNGYTRVGIYCHAKGTFQEYVPEGKGLDVDTMYVVHKDNLIVNITFAWEHAIAITKEEDEGKIVSHRFPTYKFKEGQIPAFYKYLILDKRMEYNLMVASPGGAGRNRVLNKEQFLQIPIKHPSITEQQKIADFLSCIDSKIKNQEQIVKDYEDIKKGLIQKLFSQQIRFKKQDGSNYPDWQSSIFSEVFSILKNNTLSRDNLNYNNGSIKNIHYGDVLIKFGSTLDYNNTLIPYINLDAEPSKLDLLQKGDVIFADTAEDYTAGKATELINVSDKIVSGLHTIPCRPKIKFVSGYLGYFLNSPTFHNQIIPYLAGTKVYSINKSNINLTTVYYPCSEEQERIVEILSCYDLKISKEKQILEDYKTLKKALLQQMFP